MVVFLPFYLTLRRYKFLQNVTLFFRVIYKHFEDAFVHIKWGAVRGVKSKALNSFGGGATKSSFGVQKYRLDSVDGGEASSSIRAARRSVMI